MSAARTHEEAAHEAAVARALLRHVGRARATRVLARLLVLALVLAALVLAVTPWQQTSQGSGAVIAYSPADRQQSIEAPIEGRVVTWHVREGDHVTAGQRIVDLADNDPLILMRLEAERQAVHARIEAARRRASSVGGRIGSLESSRKSAAQGAGARVQMARDRVRAAEQAIVASAAAHRTARLNLDRQRQLLGGGLSSRRQLELAELEEARARTDLDRAETSLAAARNEESALAADQTRILADTSATIQDAGATRAIAEGEIASAIAELARIDVRLARQTVQEVKATRDGTIQRVVARQGGEMVKSGDVLCVIVPDTADRAVELWVSGNDMPLVAAGREVRLQLEGWPALAFSGWPQAAVGTFGGRVAFVDPADDGHGRFRVVVVPDGREPWPAPGVLRQGVRAVGWVMLGRVSLGYELWRQWNGFPPSLPGRAATPGPGHDAKKPDSKEGK